MLKKVCLFLTAIFTLRLFLSACGSNDNQNSEKTSAEPSDSSSQNGQQSSVRIGTA